MKVSEPMSSIQTIKLIAIATSLERPEKEGKISYDEKSLAPSIYHGNLKVPDSG